MRVNGCERVTWEYFIVYICVDRADKSTPLTNVKSEPVECELEALSHPTSSGQRIVNTGYSYFAERKIRTFEEDPTRPS